MFSRPAAVTPTLPITRSACMARPGPKIAIRPSLIHRYFCLLIGTMYGAASAATTHARRTTRPPPSAPPRSSAERGCFFQQTILSGPWPHGVCRRGHGRTVYADGAMGIAFATFCSRGSCSKERRPSFGTVHIGAEPIGHRRRHAPEMA